MVTSDSSKPSLNTTEIDLSGLDNRWSFGKFTEPFNIEKAQERTRGILAIVSMALFVIVILGLAIVVVAGWRTWNEIQGLATVLLPTVTGTTGTTLAFYFAQK